MAIARRGTAVTGGSGSSAASVSINAPAAIADGDIWIVNLHPGTASGTTTVPAPAGWTGATSNGSTAGISTEFAFAFWKTWHTGDATSQTFNFNTNNAAAHGYSSVAYSGCDPINPVGAQAYGEDTVNDTTFTTVAITLKRDNSWSLLLPSLISSSPTFSSGPLSAGWSNFADSTTGKKTRVDDNGTPGAAAATVTPGSYTLSASSRGGTFHLELQAPLPTQKPVWQPSLIYLRKREGKVTL